MHLIASLCCFQPFFGHRLGIPRMPDMLVCQGSPERRSLRGQAKNHWCKSGSLNRPLPARKNKWCLSQGRVPLNFKSSGFSSWIMFPKKNAKTLIGQAQHEIPPALSTCGWLTVLRTEELPLLFDSSLCSTTTHHHARQDHLP